MGINDNASTEFRGRRVTASGSVNDCVCASCIHKVYVKNLNLSFKLLSVAVCCPVSCSSQNAQTNIVPGRNQHGHCAQHRSQHTEKLTEKDNIFLEPLDEFLLMTSHWQETIAEKFCQHHYHRFPLWCPWSTTESF